MTYIIGALALIEKHANQALYGARVIGVIHHRREASREDYWEDRYIIAWQNGHESGTHNANVNSNNQVMFTSGHYFRMREAHDREFEAAEALRDMVTRAGLMVEA